VRTSDWGGDEVRFVDGGAWMRYATVFREAKLGSQVLERRLGIVATARNSRTIGALLELARSLDAAHPQ